MKKPNFNIEKIRTSVNRFLRDLWNRFQRAFDHFADDHMWQRIISIVIAIFIWAFVRAQDTAVRFTDVSDIPVEIMGQEQLSGKNLAIKQDVSELISKPVSIRLQGTKAQIGDLNKGSVRAVVNLSRLSTDGEDQNLSISIVGAEGLTVTRMYPYDSISVDVEPLYVRDVPVEIALTGSLPNGYVMLASAPAEVTPSTITVSGSQSDVLSIKKAIVSVNIDNATSAIKQHYDYVFADENGQPIDAPALSVSSDSVIVSADIFATKTVPVHWSGSYAGTVKNGYEITSGQVSPEEITIAGEKDAVDRIEYVSTGTFSVNDRTESFTESVSIHTPSGILWMSETEADIIVNIDSIKSTIVLTDIDIEVRNAKDDWIVELSNDTVTVAVSGPQEFISKLRRSQIVAYVDLISSTADQTATLPVKFEAAADDAPSLSFTAAQIDVTIHQNERYPNES
ncbi:MAG: hypothetical protein E7334_10770 [Clostridiales bacterium]|nr:hypothetical protein [Clostridiales bacterium]